MVLDKNELKIHVNAWYEKGNFGYSHVVIPLLSVPILAGPGTISSALSSTATDSSLAHVAMVVEVFRLHLPFDLFRFHLLREGHALLKLEIVEADGLDFDHHRGPDDDPGDKGLVLLNVRSQQLVSAINISKKNCYWISSPVRPGLRRSPGDSKWRPRHRI